MRARFFIDAADQQLYPAPCVICPRCLTARPRYDQFMQTILLRCGLLAATAFIGFASAAHARTTAVIELTCPIGGEVFKTRVERTAAVVCRRFDFKRVGAMAEPPILPECPSNGFVMFASHIPDAELKKLTDWIESPAYQQQLRLHSTYYRVAHMMEFLGRGPDLVGWHLLQASWQVERSDPETYTAYCQAAIAAFDRYLAADTPGEVGLGRPTAQLLAAELSRRIGNFDDARRRLEALRSSLPSGGDPMAVAVATLHALVLDEDAAPHAASFNPDPAECEDVVRADAARPRPR